MTAAKVVDTSAIAAILFGEPGGPAIAGQLDDHRLVAPALLSFELANVCLVKCRRHPDRQAALLAAFAMRESLQIDEVAVDQAATLKLAIEQGLTAYDASYLWLARELGAELVTLDKALMQTSGQKSGSP